MGLQAHCECTWDGKTAKARAHLDSTGLDLRGSIRLHLDLAKIKTVDSGNGTLRLRSSDGVLTLKLGEKADAWAQFIKYPRSRIAKLGIKAKQRVWLAGIDDPMLDADLARLDCSVLRRETKSPVDVAMVLIDTPQKLKTLARYRQAITPDGAIWAIRPKGKATPVTEARLREAALAAYLVDIKVVSFSETHSAEKLVIPRAKR